MQFKTLGNDHILLYFKISILFIQLTTESFYYVIQSAGVQFPQRPPAVPSNRPTSQPNQNNLSNGHGEVASSRHDTKQVEPQNVPESR